MSDTINPDHYKGGGIECIDYLKAKLTDEEFRGFLKGNAIKYLSRAEKKGGAEDYKKAAWYTTMLSGVDPRKSAIAQHVIDPKNYIPGGRLLRTKEPYIVLCTLITGKPIYFYNPKEFPYMHSRATVPAEYRSYDQSEVDELLKDPNIEEVP